MSGTEKLKEILRKYHTDPTYIDMIIEDILSEWLLPVLAMSCTATKPCKEKECTLCKSREKSNGEK